MLKDNSPLIILAENVGNLAQAIPYVLIPMILVYGGIGLLDIYRNSRGRGYTSTAEISSNFIIVIVLGATQYFISITSNSLGFTPISDSLTSPFEDIKEASQLARNVNAFVYILSIAGYVLALRAPFTYKNMLKRNQPGAGIKAIGIFILGAAAMDFYSVASFVQSLVNKADVPIGQQLLNLK